MSQTKKGVETILGIPWMEILRPKGESALQVSRMSQAPSEPCPATLYFFPGKEYIYIFHLLEKAHSKAIKNLELGSRVGQPALDLKSPYSLSVWPK